ncbi:Uncharacterised protein [Mycobacteroides abscessus subsp. bolletii]|nr:Uncharacterised protein [Mycobacteroides abscessus subsp. bolletii]SLC73148.1 Uncharacterised protein [Mycobacteroides abscessus subsp. massiliense]SLI83099.1 Uncharacterised protein [Mycobacteroides abscessus subsp. abscessus]
MWYAVLHSAIGGSGRSGPTAVSAERKGSKLIKLSYPEMRQAAHEGLTLLEDYDQNQHGITMSAENLANNAMEGLAGQATHAKVLEVNQSSDRHSQNAREKFNGVLQFVDAVEQGEHERASRMNAVAV